MIGILNRLIDIYVILIIVSAILSWIPDFRSRFREIARVLERITEPVLGIFRSILPPGKTGGLDLSPILAILALRLIQTYLL